MRFLLTSLVLIFTLSFARAYATQFEDKENTIFTPTDNETALVLCTKPIIAVCGNPETALSKYKCSKLLTFLNAGMHHETIVPDEKRNQYNH
jgi:hypothetical protein